MRLLNALVIACIMLLAITIPAVADPSYIYGMHDPGGESNMANKGTKGWIVWTKAIGNSPTDYSGDNYTAWSNAGYGVIVRLNNGYGYDGNLPNDSLYGNFAQRCKNYVAASPGVTYWIVGNETNLPREWPGNIDGDPTTGQPITVARYVSCYNQCYTKMKEADANAKICPSPSGTWAPPYTAQGIPGFMDYWTQCLTQIGASKCDALPIHAYTHGCDPALITSNQLMGPPYDTIYYHFRVYRNYMNSMPTGFTTKPVLLTECDQNVECASGGYTWANTNSGWVRNAYAEINSWNQSHSQKIRCLVLFRWPDTWEGPWNFSISGRSGVVNDWLQAMDYAYTWGTVTTGTIAGSVKDTAGVGISGATVSTTTGGYSATTNSSGNYTISSVATGTYSVVASKSGYNSSTLTGKTVSSGATTTCNYTLTLADGMNTNTPTGTNLALSAPTYQTDSNYNSSYAGDKAKDGQNTAASKWTSTGTVSTHWLSYDLGASYTVNGYIVRLPGGAGELTGYNAQLFKIQSADSLAGPWTDECVVDNTAQANTVTRSYNNPKTLRYIRLYITDPGTDNWARIPEFEVWGVANTMNTNTPTGTNMAGSSTQVSTDTNYSSSYDGPKAIDGSLSTKWCSTGSVATHWIALDLGVTRNVNGFIIRNASAGGEPTASNLKNFQIQSASSMSGPWSDECVVDNTAQAGVVTRSYNTPKDLRYVRLYITNPGADNYARLYELEVYCNTGGSLSEAFETMPSWSSTYDGSWGSAATFSIVAGGQAGNFLQASRSSQGSSSKVKVYTVSTNTTYTVSVYMKCPSYAGGTYWIESACKLGNNTASDFDNNGSTWTLIKKFANDGTNGNGNAWTVYSTTINTGANTQLSVGFKHGASGCNGPTVGWDTLVIQ